MSRYIVCYTGTLVATGGATDLLSLYPDSGAACRLHWWDLRGSADFPVAVRLSAYRLLPTVTPGSGGRAMSPVPYDAGDAATTARFRARCNDITLATTDGSSLALVATTWDPSTMLRFPIDGRIAYARHGEALIVRMAADLAKDTPVRMSFYASDEDV